MKIFNKYKNKKIYKYLDNYDMVKLIIENSGNINRTKGGKNSLILSLDSNISIEIFKLLLDNNIDTNFQDKNGNTALHLCTDFNKLKLLMNYNVDLNIKNKKSFTPIFACNNIEKVQLLVDNNIDINVCDKNGKHFFRTIDTGNFDLMKIFIDKGLNRFIEKGGLTLDLFLERCTSIELQAYYENKLKRNPELYKIRK